MESELHSNESVNQGEQISIDNLPTSEPIVEQVAENANTEQTNDNSTEQN